MKATGIVRRIEACVKNKFMLFKSCNSFDIIRFFRLFNAY